MEQRPKRVVFPPEIAVITRSMKVAPDRSGLLHLARDGVLRTWDGQGKVVDYRQLSNEEVMLYLKATDVENDIKYEEWETVDGRSVTNEKLLWDPEDSIRPIHLRKDNCDDNKTESGTQSET